MSISHDTLIAITLILAIVSLLVTIVIRNWRRPSGKPTDRDEKLGLVNNFFLGTLILGTAFAACCADSWHHVPIVLIWAWGALAVGGFLGLLFGIPRILKAQSADSNAKPSPTNPNPQAPAGKSLASSARTFTAETNNNLIEVSDWLTKIIVGVGLVQLGNAPGHLRRIATPLATCLGDNCGLAIAAGVIVFFSVAGFLAGSINARTLISSIFVDAAADQQRQDEANRSALAPAGDIELDATSGEAVFRVDPTAKAAAKEWLEREPDAHPSFDDLIGDARAHVALGNPKEAIPKLEQALRLRPGNAVAMLLLAAALVDVDDHASAVDVLESLIRQAPGQAPLNVWKLLGYALLFHDPAAPDYRAALRRSIDASTKYLNVTPDDLGALLNRACAYGQLGPEEPGAAEPMLADLRRLIAATPEAREHIRALTKPGLDFNQWIQNAEFQKLLQGT
jgi:tetratricopeptide (TPR) repeat protein